MAGPMPVLLCFAAGWFTQAALAGRHMAKQGLAPALALTTVLTLAFCPAQQSGAACTGGARAFVPPAGRPGGLTSAPRPALKPGTERCMTGSNLRRTLVPQLS